MELHTNRKDDEMPATLTHEQNLAERTAILAEQGFAAGDTVRVTVDGHPNLPAHVRFMTGDEGEVVLNLAHGPDKISVRFAGKMLHAIAPANLEVI